MSGIRLTYSGLISFVVMIGSLFTGLIFIVIVTRTLSQDEFGLWTLIGGLVVYVMIFEPISTYWVIRQVARNEKVSVTGIGTSGVFSIIGSGIYLVIIFFISNTTGANYETLLLSTIMIPLLFLNSSLISIIAGYKPQGNAYGTLIFETIKIPSGLVFVYFGELGLVGAILAISVSQSSRLAFSLFYVKEKLMEQFNTIDLKNWLKLSWLPIISTAHDKIIAIDLILYSTFVGGVSGLSFVGAARTIGNFVGYGKLVSVGLYPKLISSQKSDYIELMFKRTMFFSIPMLGMSFVFAKSGLWILNPIYVEGILIVYAWSIVQFLYIFESIFQSILLGIEKVDVNFNSKFLDYIKSKLVTVPIIFGLGRAAYLGVLAFILILSVTLELTEIETLVWWGVGAIFIDISIVTVFWIISKKNIGFHFPVKVVLKYIVSTIISTVTLGIVLNEFLTYEESIFIFVPTLIPYLLLYLGIYLLIILCWDSDSRNFIKLIFREIKR